MFKVMFTGEMQVGRLRDEGKISGNKPFHKEYIKNANL